MGVARAISPQESGNAELMDLLRRSVDDENRSTDSLLAGIAEAARQLTGAEAAALALEQNGTIICRSRSGPIGPELGAPVNTHAGISGECLRRATILISTDTLRDTRVDPDVCLSLGIRSIAVVPLRGKSRMIGILEVFSGRPGAFENEQIDLLRDLAVIAEGAHEREQLRLSASEPARPAALLAAMTAHRWRGFDVLATTLKRDYRIIAAAMVAIVLISVVVWTSFRKTQAEIAASEATPQTQALSPVSGKDSSVPKLSKVVPPSPVPGTSRNHSNGSNPQSVLQKAAELSPVGDRPSAPVGGEAADRGIAIARGTKPVPKEAPPVEPPPAVELALSATPGVPVTVVTTPSLPPFVGPVSQATEAKLIRRVEPVYPPQARIQRLEGSVVLDATIGRDGTVRSTKIVSGPVALAESAVTAVRNWRYNPATLNGNPTEVLTRITVVFKLP
jgi:TonB family protein